MAKTFSMEFELTAKLSNAYNAVFAGANQQLGELKTKLSSLAQNNATINKFKDLQANTHNLSSQFNQSQLKVKELALAIKNTANPTKKLTNEFERAQVATSTLNNKLKTKRNELNEVRLALEKAGISTTNLTTHEKSLALETDKLANKEQKFSSVLAKRAELQQKADNWKGKVFSTIALGGIAIAPIMLAAKAQEASAEFKTSMMDATGKVSPEFAKLNALASKFGRSLPLTTAEYRSMFLELKKGGIESESILNGVGRATAYLATVTHISTDDAAKYASNLIKATGASTKEAMSLIDIMQRLEDVKVAPAEIAEAFQKLSGVLRTTNSQGVAGVKAYAPLIAMFTRQGMNGGDAGQTISKIINASMLIRQSTLNAIQSMYGLQFKFTNKNGNFAGIESFMQQLEKIKTLNARGQADVIKNLFGNKPAILAVVTQLMNGLNEYRALNKEITQQADITQKMGVHLGLLTVKLKNWSATIKAITVAIGEPLAQMIIPFIDMAQKGLESILPFIKSHQKLIGVLAIVASSLVLVKVAALALVAIGYLFSSTWASVMVVLLSLSKIMKVVTAVQWLWNAALMANPLTLIIGGIILVVGVLGYFAYKTKFATEMWQSFKTALGNITWIKNISTVFKGFTDTFSSPNLNVTAPSFKTLLANSNTKGSTAISYKPTINMHGSYSPDALTKTLKDSHQDLIKLMTASFANERRLAFN